MQQYNGRILLVDDEAMVRDSLSEWLQMEDFEVQTASGGEEALELCKGRAYDVGIFDVRMPGMDGLTLLAKVKEICPNMPVVIMTAYATIENAVECLQKGAYDYVIKPFPPEKLSLLVQQIRQLQRLQASEASRLQQVERMQCAIQQFKDAINLGIYMQTLPPQQLRAAIGAEWTTPVNRQQLNDRFNLPSFLLGIGAPYNADVQVSQMLPAVQADPAGLYWAVLNCLDNAKRAAGEGPVVLKSGLVDTRKLFIEISSAGQAIAEPELVFEPFYSKWRDGRGQGLGLWVARYLVQHMRGKTEIKSMPNGTTLQIIYLPVLHE
jgi:CheY-like chemotaxis protein